MGWKPAIYESGRTVLRLAGFSDQENLTLRRTRNAAVRIGRVAEGDVFFKSNDVYYLAFVDSADEQEMDAEIRYRAYTSESLDVAEVGIITNSTDSATEKLTQFIQDIEKSAIEIVDGRKARHLTFEWKEIVPEKYLNEIVRENGEAERVNFKVAELHESEVNAANILSTSSERELLIDISSLGFVRHQDLMRRKTKDEYIEKSLDILKKNDLVKTEFLLECRSNSNRLTKLPSREKLESEEVARSHLCFLRA